MLISPAYAQAAGGAAAGGGNMVASLLPFVLIIIVFYFLLIRPQQKRAKEHKAMVEGVRRGDTVVTAGGLIAKVTKVIDEHEVQVEIAENVRVRVLKGTLSDVKSKGEPLKEPAGDASNGKTQ